MGLFSGFNPVKAITRAVGIPDVVSKPIQYALAPLTVPTSVGIQLGSKLASKAFATSPGVQQIHENVPQPLGAGNQLQPAGPTYIYGGGGGGYSPYQGGPSPWDYSTPLIPSFQPQLVTYPTYSPGPTSGGDRTWEDLILGSLPFL